MVKAKTLYLLDTNTVSYVVTGRSRAARVAYTEAEAHAQIAVSSITEGEIRYGIAKKPGDRRARGHMEEFLARTNRLSWDSAASESYAMLRAQMEKAGTMLGALDTLIAAHALSLGAILVTHDRGLHQVSSHLPVEDWATDL